MLRTALVTICILALSSTAFAVVDIQGQGPITVKLTIQAYTQVWFQDDNWSTPPAAGEPDIVFSGTQGVDYYRSLANGLIGKYLPTDGSSGTAEDGWAMGFFESNDGATIWMQSNTDFSGTLTTTGDLNDGSGNTVPTWFTIAVTGYDGTIPGPDPNGFRLGNAPGGWVADGIIPGASMGGYAGDGTSGGQDVAGPITFGFGNKDFWPIQDAFQMATTTGWLFDLDAPVGPGTMKFLARVKRAGVVDVAGSYTATITPTFTVP